METWSKEMLSRFGDADTLLVVTRRADGTLRKPVPVWVVRMGDDLFIRAVRGRYSSWYRGAMERRDGQILTGDDVLEVLFEPADPALLDAIDMAYRRTYSSKSQTHLGPILTASARAATLRLVPAATKA